MRLAEVQAELEELRHMSSGMEEAVKLAQRPGASNTALSIMTAFKQVCLDMTRVEALIKEKQEDLASREAVQDSGGQGFPN